MKRILSFLSILTIISPVFADDDPAAQTFSRTLPTGFTLGKYGDLYTNTTASASYVNGAYDAMDYLKENKLNDKTGNATATNGDVVHNTAAPAATATAPYVASVNAAGGVVTVVNSEVTIPVASYTAPTSRANIWVE